MPRILVLLILSAGLAVSCSDLTVDVRIDGELSYGRCTQEVLPWEPPFASYHQTDEGSGVFRFQSQAGPLEEDDHLVITISDVASVNTQLGQRIPIRPITEPGRAQATLNFRERCPSEASLVTTSQGWIEFDRFSGDFDSIASGRFEFDVFDARDGDVLGTGITGEFSFEIERFRPYQSFH